MGHDGVGAVRAVAGCGDARPSSAAAVVREWCTRCGSHSPRGNDGTSRDLPRRSGGRLADTLLALLAGPEGGSAAPRELGPRAGVLYGVEEPACRIHSTVGAAYPVARRIISRTRSAALGSLAISPAQRARALPTFNVGKTAMRGLLDLPRRRTPTRAWLRSSQRCDRTGSVPKPNGGALLEPAPHETSRRAQFVPRRPSTR